VLEEWSDLDKAVYLEAMYQKSRSEMPQDLERVGWFICIAVQFGIDLAQKGHGHHDMAMCLGFINFTLPTKGEEIGN